MKNRESSFDDISKLINQPSVGEFVIHIPVQADIPILGEDLVWWKPSPIEQKKSLLCKDVVIEEDDVTLLSGRKVMYIRRNYINTSTGRLTKQFFVREKGRYMKEVEIPINEWPLFGIDMIDDTSPIVVAEGLKATKSLMNRNVQAVGTFSAHIDPAALIPLYGREVIIWPDNDEAGVNLMIKIAEELLQNNAKVKILRWVDGPYHGDAADYELDVNKFLASAEAIDPVLFEAVTKHNNFPVKSIPMTLKSRRKLYASAEIGAIL